MGIGAIMSLFHISEEPAAGLFVGIWLVGSSYLIWFARRLRVVSIDERTLFVSAGREEIQIPFSSVERVKENFWANPKIITLTLKATVGVRRESGICANESILRRLPFASDS